MILKQMMREDADVFTATENDRICDVASEMRQHRVGSLVVIDRSNQVIGMITDRDIALSLALGAATPDSFISEVMTRDVKTIPENINLFDVTHYFRTVDVKRLPVVDNDQQLVGIISCDDVIAFLARQMFDTCHVLEPKLGHTV